MEFNCLEILPHKSEDYLVDVLCARGIDDPKRYIAVDENSLTDGFLLDGMREALKVIHDIVTTDTPARVAITVDSDVDGFTSAAIMHLYLSKVGNVEMIPFLHEGKQHGIDDIIDDILECAPDLIIVPDASTSEIEMHKRVYEANIPIVILDHHLSDVKVDPYAIRINNQLSDKFPNKTLCGAGVVYKFCECYDYEYGFEYATDYIDLAAVGLVADMMDLRNAETHYLVKQGLKNITNPGLQMLVSSQSFSLGGRSKLNPVDVAFYVAPYINAMVRVGSMDSKRVVYEALIDGTRIVPSTKRGAKNGEIEILGEQAARLMKNAKALQQRLVDSAMDVLESKIFKFDLLENKVILIPVSDEDNIPSTLTGLVAMKITAKYHKPTLILRECDDGILKGSARAEDGTKMGGFKEYLEQTGLFEYNAGHSMAFGAGLAQTKVDDFLKVANEQLKDINFNEKAYTVDYLFTGEESGLSDIVFALDEGKSYWGQNLQEPTFGVKRIKLSKDDVTLMKNNCLKFSHDGVSFVIFKNEQAIADFTEFENMYVDVYCRGSVNEWCGRKSAQMIVSGYEIHNAARDKYVF